MFRSNLESDPASTGVTRRTFLIGSAAAAAGAAFLSLRPRHVVAAVDLGPPKMVKIVNFSDTGKRLDTVTVPKVVKSEDEWRKQLSSASFEITRHADTEMAYTGATWDNHERGLYRCICCDTALFSSETKFDSHTGWPSFYQPIARENVVETKDRTLGMLRVAVSCARCDAHLGHVFDDGPLPTHERYCMNSASMRFVKA